MLRFLFKDRSSMFSVEERDSCVLSENGDRRLEGYVELTGGAIEFWSH